MAGGNRASDPAFELDAENECQQQLGAGHRPQLGEREQRRGDRRGRMDDRRNMGVAEIERIGARRVQECRAQAIHAFAAADDGGLPQMRELGEGAQRDLHRIGAAARERHGKEIQQRPLGFMADGLRDVVPPRRNDETGKILRDAGSVQHGAVPSVAQRCHLL